MKFYLRYLIIIMTTAAFALAPLQASENDALIDVQSEEELLAFIDNLNNSSITSVANLIAQYEQVRELAKDKKWEGAYLTASMRKLWRLHSLGELAKAKDILEETLPLARELQYQDTLAQLSLFKLRIQLELGDYTNIDQTISDLIEAARLNTENQPLAASIHVELGRAYSKMGNYESAMIFLEKAYALFEATDDTYHLSYVLSSLASVSADLEDNERAIEYYQEALAIVRQHNDKVFEATLLHNLGVTFFENQQEELAMQSYQQSLRVSEEIDDEIGIAWAQVSISDVNASLGKWDETVSVLAEALATFEKTGDVIQQISVMLNQVKAYLNLGNLAKAESILTEIDNSFEDVEFGELRLSFLEQKAALAYQKGQYKDAYNIIQEQTQLKDTLFEDKQVEVSQKYKTLFDTNLKDKQNRILQQDNELKSIKIAQQQEQEKTWLLIISLSVILILVVAAFLILQTKNQNRFKTLALRDSLTNSPNRRAVLKFAQESFEQAKTHKRDLAIAIVDLDHFKKLNDTFGHDTGDCALINFSKACHQELRQHDGFGRYGGEEWLFVFHDTSKEQISEIFNRIKITLNNMPCPGLSENHPIHFSMGAARYDANIDENLNALIKRADQKLYDAKENGRDQYKF